MSLDISELAPYLSILSSLAIIASAIMVIFQLRQGTRENRANTAFSMLESITSDSFERRRAHVYKIVAKYSPNDYVDFLNTADDFEFRNYAYTFELFGQFIKDGVVDRKPVMNVGKYIIVTDWKVMEPLLKCICQAHGFKLFPWENFEWLAKETEKYLLRLESQKSTSYSNGNRT